MTTTRSSAVAGACGLAGLVVAGLAFAGGVPAGRRQHLPAPDYLNEAGRAALDARMKSHPDEMNRLLQAVVLLDHGSTAAIAHSLADEPSLQRSTLPDDPLRALPQRVIDLDGEFHDRARKLAAAAKDGKNDAMAQRFGELTQTCVACHAAYLSPGPAAPSP